MPTSDRLLSFAPLIVKGEQARVIVEEIRRPPTEKEILVLRRATIQKSVDRDILVKVGLVKA